MKEVVGSHKSMHSFHRIMTGNIRLLYFSRFLAIYTRSGQWHSTTTPKGTLNVQLHKWLSKQSTYSFKPLTFALQRISNSELTHEKSFGQLISAMICSISSFCFSEICMILQFLSLMITIQNLNAALLIKPAKKNGSFREKLKNREKWSQLRQNAANRALPVRLRQAYI